MLSKYLFSSLLILCAANFAFGQSGGVDASKRSASDRGSDVAPSERMLETQYRWRLRAEEKEFNEMLDRSRDAAQLSETIKSSFEQNNNLTAADYQKLQQLEKQIKKVRRDLGGDGDGEPIDENAPASLRDALDELVEVGTTLNEDLKKRTRYEVSADSINNTNRILELIEFIRARARAR